MEKAAQKKFKRKKLNLSVKREFQMWLLARIFGVICVSAVVAVLVLYLYSRQEISSTFYSAHIQLRRVSDLLFPVMASGACVSLLSGVLLALFLPQKIAGPIYRVQKVLDVIKTGDLCETVILRKNDIFMDLADSVNVSTASLREKVLRIKEIQQELDRLVASLESREAAEVSARQNLALEEIRTEK